MKAESHQELTRNFSGKALSSYSYTPSYRSLAPTIPAGYSVLDHLKDCTHNPSANDDISREAVKQQVYDFMNIYRHSSRVLPKWDKQINLKVVANSLDDHDINAFSTVLNQMSLLTNVNVAHHYDLRVDNYGFHCSEAGRMTNTNAMIIFTDGKDQICLDDEIRSVLAAVGKKPVDVYQRIDQSCVNNKQATEYRTLRYGREGSVAFFLYIVDISWIRKAALDDEDKSKIMAAQFLHSAFRLFSLQDGVSDSIKYSFMNHKYFWRNMSVLSPIDSAFLSILYSDGMQKRRSKYNATRYIAHKVWKSLK